MKVNMPSGKPNITKQTYNNKLMLNINFYDIELSSNKAALTLRTDINYSRYICL